MAIKNDLQDWVIKNSLPLQHIHKSLMSHSNELNVTLSSGQVAREKEVIIEKNY